MARSKKTLSPRQRVANHLYALGYAFNEEDIQFVHGGAHKRLSDIIQCWSLFCVDPAGKQVEIQSANTLTECARGFDLVPNTRDSELYGDLIAVPKSKPQ